MSTTADDLYYDPYDFEIDADPYPVWRRMRDEQPLFYNEKYDFYALSRFDDVEAGLEDWGRLTSGKGAVLELIKTNAQVPIGTASILPTSLHRGGRHRVSPIRRVRPGGRTLLVRGRRRRHTRYRTDQLHRPPAHGQSDDPPDMLGRGYRAVTGIEPFTPMEPAYPLVFMCSRAASAVTGVTLVSDSGYFSSGLTEPFPPATGIANYLSGRM